MLDVYNYIYSDLAESVAAFFYCGIIENFEANRALAVFLQALLNSGFLAIAIRYFDVKLTIIINKLIIRLKAQ